TALTLDPIHRTTIFKETTIFKVAPDAFFQRHALLAGGDAGVGAETSPRANVARRLRGRRGMRVGSEDRRRTPDPRVGSGAIPVGLVVQTRRAASRPAGSTTHGTAAIRPARPAWPPRGRPYPGEELSRGLHAGNSPHEETISASGHRPIESAGCPSRPGFRRCTSTVPVERGAHQDGLAGPRRREGTILIPAEVFGPEPAMLRQLLLNPPQRSDPDVIREGPLAEFGHVLGVTVREHQPEAIGAGRDLGGGD